MCWLRFSFEVRGKGSKHDHGRTGIKHNMHSVWTKRTDDSLGKWSDIRCPDYTTRCRTWSSGLRLRTDTAWTMLINPSVSCTSHMPRVKCSCWWLQIAAYLGENRTGARYRIWRRLWNCVIRWGGVLALAIQVCEPNLPNFIPSQTHFRQFG